MKSVTEAEQAEEATHQNFNPHTREECDAQANKCTWRKTWDFNPHTREECDKVLFFHDMAAIDFNPHTREECDGLF